MSMNGIRLLAAGILKQAVKDRRDSERTLAARPGSEAALAMRRELDVFFAGAWCRFLVDLCPDLGRNPDEEARR